MKRYQKSLFIFRRDLRLADNTALNSALAQSRQVILSFIFDPRQIEPHPYQSQPALQFMLQALRDLQRQIAERGGLLYLFNDHPERVITRLRNDQNIEAVFVNRDYTPFSRQRDADLQKHCGTLGLGFHSHGDLLLNEPEQVLKSDGSPYRVFTAFYQRARQNPVASPQGLSPGLFIDTLRIDAGEDLIGRFSRPHNNPLLGGRSAALALLENLTAHRDYQQQRDFPALAATSHMSAYLKFGCCSIREAYYAIAQSLGDEHPLLRQLYWRDFFTHIAFHYPHVFDHAFHRRFDAIRWQNDDDWFSAWTEGRTGFPIVDAGMRELLQTSCMHNRLRMITASFLVKDLHFDWRWGERYFARHLLDYDPCINNGNWQWAASTGCDAQPYFRIFNPWLQQKKFDADCVYIKRWLPELRLFPATVIHHWHKQTQACDYPSPIVDHGVQSQHAKALYRAITP
ncbi:MAG: DNA photolyase family protein [Methylococcaceae bacterium]|nr:DNA photolyase family protein [Methylococcaceae bacterium]